MTTENKNWHSISSNQIQKFVPIDQSEIELWRDYVHAISQGPAGELSAEQVAFRAAAFVIQERNLRALKNKEELAED